MVPPSATPPNTSEMPEGASVRHRLRKHERAAVASRPLTIVKSKTTKRVGIDGGVGAVTLGFGGQPLRDRRAEQAPDGRQQQEPPPDNAVAFGCRPGFLGEQLNFTVRAGRRVASDADQRQAHDVGRAVFEQERPDSGNRTHNDRQQVDRRSAAQGELEHRGATPFRAITYDASS